ncbi:MAG: ribosome-associated translation inhibitor RaiA [Bacteroidia bacterium]|jgi:ribosome-associated translation inhibitor RaiA
MKKEVALLHHAYPPSLRDYVEQRLDGPGKFNERMTGIRAVFDHQHNDHTVELVASIGGSGPLVVETKASSPRLALKHAVASLTTSLKRHRTKFLDSRHKAGPTT